MSATAKGPLSRARETSPTRPDDCLIIIFGASGDLTKRKLVPALYYLWDRGQAPDNFAVLGVSRTSLTDGEYRDRLHDFSPASYDDARWRDFAGHIHYHAADPTQPDGWAALKARAASLAEAHRTGDNILFYLAVAPQLFEPIILHIGSSGLVAQARRVAGEWHAAWQRIVVEKPFGSDLRSAIHLNRVLAGVFDEEDIYRIDHYLGKELVQNLMVVRFANALFEPIWNHLYVDHVQITASETVALEGRGSYYDGPAGGALRDMVQSHLLQVLSLVAMEPPITLDAADVRAEKLKVFKALRVPSAAEIPEIAVRGQYAAGSIVGEPVPAYRDTEGIDAQSQTETFAAVKFFVDTWRWGGVPFYLRSGKAMAQKKTEIGLFFKLTPHRLFRDQAKLQQPNQVIINVQPNEGIRLRFEGKVPGLGLDIKPVVMEFDYEKQWQASPADSYALLLSDCLRGDLTNYKHREEVESSWDACAPVLDFWADHALEALPTYAAGTWGPAESEILMTKEGRRWRNG